VKAGSIRSHNGLLRVSEADEDRANNIAERRPRAKTAAVARQSLHAAVQRGDATPAVSAQGTLDFGRARAKKESYNSHLRELEYQVKAGQLVKAEVVRDKVFKFSREDRDAWMNWPARVAPLIAATMGIDQVALAVEMERYVRDHLAERSIRFSL
jgi:hypothetical protein